MGKFILPLFVLIVIFTFGPRSSAGVGSLSGKNRGMWRGNGYSVILAEVKRCTPLADPTEGTHNAVLEPIATLAGTFDATEQPSLEVLFYASDVASSIKAAPPVGSLVLAVICNAPINGDATKMFPYITSDRCDFMPLGSALVVLDGIDDKRIRATAKSIREMRAHTDDHDKADEAALPRGLAETRPSTPPVKNDEKKKGKK